MAHNYTSNADPFGPWPRVDELRPGVYRIKGRYRDLVRWHLLGFVTKHAARLIGVVLVLAGASTAVHGLAAVFDPGGVVSWGLEHLLTLKLGFEAMLSERFASFGEVLRYPGTQPYDYHLIILGVLVFGFFRPVGWVLHRLLAIPLWPLVTRVVRVTITPETVTVHRFGRSLRLSRSMSAGGAVSFRVGDLDEHPGPLTRIMGFLSRRGSAGQDTQDPVVMVMQGLRGHRIATPLSPGRCGLIGTACHTALQRARII